MPTCIECLYLCLSVTFRISCSPLELPTFHAFFLTTPPSRTLAVFSTELNQFSSQFCRGNCSRALAMLGMRCINQRDSENSLIRGQIKRNLSVWLEYIVNVRLYMCVCMLPNNIRCRYLTSTTATAATITTATANNKSNFECTSNEFHHVLHIECQWLLSERENMNALAEDMLQSESNPKLSKTGMLHLHTHGVRKSQSITQLTAGKRERGRLRDREREHKDCSA